MPFLCLHKIFYTTRLREMRKKKNLTISKFSELINLSDKIISNYENGKNLITIESIVKIYKSNVFYPMTLTELLDILVVSVFE
ncbi:XRE family transcriptional regulator [Streptococcus iniae]|nr:XRE family transcriptional regulator [Streptococcus iniae]RLU76087.1 XRE family transcriptional regulator [Streptococcus iniae]RLV03648.1 XRE family transcriptional regulator [Streptococcus iniae]RLV20387.1 XRE family transcriptional regulator [Streptococcus iniae]RLV25513.1 XRE family transcriptional regulator [Streptococcus iniae]